MVKKICINVVISSQSPYKRSKQKNRATGATEPCNYLIISQSSVQDRLKIVLLWRY